MQVSYKQIWMISYPIMLSLMMEQVVGITDTAFLGRVGEVALGAAALSSVYFMAIYMLGFGFSMGAQIMISHRNGAGNRPEIGAIFYEGTLFLIGLAVLAFAVTRWGSHWVLAPLIRSPEVLAGCMEYLDWRAWGFFFAFASLMYRAFYVGIEHTKAFTYASVLMVAVNVVLDYLLVFGKAGFPEMGIGGAALASSIAEACQLVFFVVYTRFRIDGKAYAFRYLRKIDLRRMGALLKLSGWTMGQYFVAVSVWFVFFLAVEHLGERALAVSNIIRSLSVVWFMVLAAFSSAASTIAGNLMGAGKPDGVPEATRKTFIFASAFLVPALLLVAAFPNATLRIYTDDAGIIADARASLWVIVAACVWALPAHVLQKVISGIGNTRAAFFIELAALGAYLAYVVVAIYLLKSPVAVCWVADHVYWLVMLVCSVAYFKRANWRAVRV